MSTRLLSAEAPIAAKSARIAIIDIGSNTIRLVVYDRLSRAPIPVFNERIFGALGRDLNESGELGEEARNFALRNLERFCRLALEMEAGEVSLIATAAVREAKNGTAFTEQVRRATGFPVTVLSGEEEARIAAHGVIAGIADARGVVGDLGGGSLEIVEVGDGEAGRSATLPLGPLRLAMADDPEGAKRRVDQALKRVAWLRGRDEQADFYPVGGAWRAFARLHMRHTGYPLHMIHNYSISRQAAEDFARSLRASRQDAFVKEHLPRRRADAMPAAALVMERMLRLVAPRQVTFSVFGLREGALYDRLPEDERRTDPLVATARELGAAEGRFGAIGDALYDWMSGLYPDGRENRRRLRLAACHLSDTAWREHPEYRAVQSLNRVLHFPFAALDHPGRAFIAYTLYLRYGGAPGHAEAAPALALLSRRAMRRAEVTGFALRLAYTISAGVRANLERSRLTEVDGELRLTLPEGGDSLMGEAVDRRFAALARAGRYTSRRIIS